MEITILTSTNGPGFVSSHFAMAGTTIGQADYPGLRVGPEPTTDKFVAIMAGPSRQQLPGDFHPAWIAWMWKLPWEV